MNIDKQNIDWLCRELFIMATCKPIDIKDQKTLKTAFDTIQELFWQNEELEDFRFRYESCNK